MIIDSQFDSGNIETVGEPVHGAACQTIHLRIRTDAHSQFLQWFHFRAAGIRNQRIKFVIDNAGATTYPDGWKGYDVVCSTDRQSWTRTAAEYDGKTLSWTVELPSDQIWFSYFAPYSLAQHADLIATAALAPSVHHEVLGLTAQGRPIDYLHVRPLALGNLDDNDADRQSVDISTDKPLYKSSHEPSRKRLLWVIARQHPGESMAEWFVQGWLERLLDVNDATSRALRQLADIHVVPNMNPDGSYLGHLRTNALGVNLNREWANPSIEHSPEVFHVLERMKATGIDLALDVHGDEALPYNFIAGTEGIADWNEERNQELVNLKHTWGCINPDFQDKYGYPINAPGKANMSICSNQLAQSFGSLALTLEMPFKDTANNSRPDVGWSAQRSIRLGTSFVDVAYLALTKRLLSRDKS